MSNYNGILSDQDKIDAVALYKAGHTTVELGKKYGVHSNSVRSILARRGVERRSRIYTVNEDYFHEIDTAEKAYWFGFILADGSVKRYALRLELHKKDKGHLEKLKSAMESSNPVRFPKSRNSCTLHINSKKVVNDLSRYGCTSNKVRHVASPDIDPCLYRHFVRGYFDGDGWITQRLHSQKWKIWQCGLLSSSEKIIKEIHAWVVESVGRSFGSDYRTGRGYYQLDFSGKRSTLSFLELLYEDASVFLDRKMKLYREIV